MQMTVGCSRKESAPVSQAAAPAVAVAAAVNDAGAKVYKTYCETCHGTKGEIDDIKAIVHDGAAKHGESPLMARWPMLTPDQLQAVAKYVKSLHGS